MPDEVRFQAKAEIALDLLDWAVAQAIPFAVVTSKPTAATNRSSWFNWIDASCAL